MKTKIGQYVQNKGDFQVLKIIVLGAHAIFKNISFVLETNYFNDDNNLDNILQYKTAIFMNSMQSFKKLKLETEILLPLIS